MSEVVEYMRLKQKLNDVCEENALRFRLIKERYPITLTIVPEGEDREQIGLFTEEEKDTEECSITFDMLDGELSTTTVGKFIISEALFNRLRSLYKSLHTAWQRYFFREVMERELMPDYLLPQVNNEVLDREIIGEEKE